MDKIHNNLNVENLIKTEYFKNLTLKQKEELLTNSQWFKQFDEDQQYEIIKGLKNNLNILIYAKKEFDEYKMNQIRLGLEKKLDVSVYAKKEFDSGQMKQIRKGLENDVDVYIYANLSFDSKQEEVYYRIQQRPQLLLK